VTSPEGRLRCGRPSTFVPAILPPPINSNFGASPTRFSPSFPLSLYSSNPPALCTCMLFRLSFFSLRSLPSAPVSRLASRVSRLAVPYAVLGSNLLRPPFVPTSCLRFACCVLERENYRGNPVGPAIFRTTN